MGTFIDIVLAPEVISAVLIVVSVLMAVKVVIQFSGEVTGLRGRLLIVDSRLEKLRTELPEKRKRVEELSQAVRAILPKELRLRQYYEVLMELKIQVEREEQKQEEQERIKHERDKAKRDLRH